MKNCKLYIVSTPIGNYKDITLRALEVIRGSDFIICEEYKAARRLLSQYNIDKDLIALNEHNEKANAPDIIKEILAGKKTALISDCGTPLFSDPGNYLVELCISNNITVIPVPGASSLLPALTASGLDIEKFFYYGWLSPKTEIRKQELKKLKAVKHLIVLLDTPYRLRKILSEVNTVFGSNQKVVLAYKITMEEEEFFRGTIKEVKNIAELKKLKGEFVLMIDNR
ncbi:MAG: 16S rRNA (cytidine(1402)-2'-O)-methyltransferase [Ignavibacteriae bacterium]|nr:16S rRNA (cytidine(1402)-2'-O)-methyltransferase [Ignavibacteriota bacterium]NOG99052.1 16S rRNA (cytidine(1402)-2'-O)-methyltransferase [Ignavibacteriota bacterium]